MAAILQHGAPLQAVCMDQTATRTMKDTNTELTMAAILQHGPRLHVVIASATNLALTITGVTTILNSVLLTDDMVVFKLSLFLFFLFTLIWDTPTLKQYCDALQIDKLPVASFCQFDNLSLCLQNQKCHCMLSSELPPVIIIIITLHSLWTAFHRIIREGEKARIRID